VIFYLGDEGMLANQEQNLKQGPGKEKDET
jgi:hypothetical protein